jgi:hyperosmotically inducible periplasmic protein
MAAATLRNVANSAKEDPMTRALNAVFVLVLFAFLAAGCQSMTGETAGENVDDASITSAVKAKLAGERVGTLTQVGVETVRSTVYLTGVVPTAEDKRRAEDIASQVKGVRKVVNNLQIKATNP